MHNYFPSSKVVASKILLIEVAYFFQLVKSHWKVSIETNMVSLKRFFLYDSLLNMELY